MCAVVAVFLHIFLFLDYRLNTHSKKPFLALYLFHFVLGWITFVFVETFNDMVKSTNFRKKKFVSFRGEFVIFSRKIDDGCFLC